MKKFLLFLRDILTAFPLLILGNGLIFWNDWTGGTFSVKIIILLLLIMYDIWDLFFPEHKQAESRKLAMLSHGIRLLRQGCICSILQVFVIMMQISGHDNLMLLLGNQLIFSIMMAGILLGGVIRVAISSKQVSSRYYLAFILIWWMPVLNVIVLAYIGKIGRREFYFERAKAEQNIARQESEICRTKYPVLMVHGIFFRDWQLFNYWGRIPAELQKNGAMIFYGKQQSAQSVAKSAEELHQQIHNILKQTGAEKINIIAHSKGGLDSRYAMAVLGDASYVASLTTINTPHHGCAWVDNALQTIPVNIQNWIDRKYYHIFHVLGDTSPAFLEGVRDLTASHCEKFNQQCPLSPDVYYQCIVSEMPRAFSAPFPLWLGYLCIHSHDATARNDGLVPTDSAKLSGVPFQVLTTSKNRGISHGDMIDLNRENIPDFDVREFYVKLVQDLKTKGF